VLLRERALGFAGRIAMDLVMLDVTDIPDVSEGDEVVIIGKQGAARQTAQDLADAASTISHDIISGIRRRVPRRYHHGGRVVAQRTMADGYVKR
jgi:alanine racemase